MKISELFRTMAAYELFLRLCSERDYLRTVVLESEVNLYAGRFLKGREEDEENRNHEDTSGEA